MSPLRLEEAEKKTEKVLEHVTAIKELLRPQPLLHRLDAVTRDAARKIFDLSQISEKAKTLINDPRFIVWEVTTNWLTPDYLGRDVWEKFNRKPVEVGTISKGSLGSNSVQHFAGAIPAGLYITASIPILAPILDPLVHKIYLSKEEHDRNPDNGRSVITHELLHRASYIGGGLSNMRWQDNGVDIRIGRVPWLHEGLTEFHAQQLVRQHTTGFHYFPSYEVAVTVSFYLQSLVGENTLRKAYISGDFSVVRDMVNKKLGAGTFETIIESDNANNAFWYLRNKLKDAGIDVSNLDLDPFISRVVKEILRDSGPKPNLKDDIFIKKKIKPKVGKLG